MPRPLQALGETNSSIPVISAFVARQREAKAMTDITYDPEADAVYITFGRGTVDRTEETGPFIYDVDGEGHILGIEILSASKILAAGDRKKSGLHGAW
jgi:uncharacterized protein YuzE